MRYLLNPIHHCTAPKVLTIISYAKSTEEEQLWFMSGRTSKADNPKKKDVYRKNEMKDLRYPIIINVFSFFNEMENACICLYTHSFGKDSIQTVDQKCPKGLFCFLEGELI